MEDRYGNALGTTSDAAAAAYRKGVDHILEASFGATDAFHAAVEIDPGFALGHAGLARALMYDADMAGARAAISKAKEVNSSVSDRELAHIEILDLMLSGFVPEAREAVKRHAVDYPLDALAVQAGTNVFGLIGFSGCPGRESDLLAYTSMLAPHYGEDWWMMSMQALSLCETGNPQASLRLMERSLELNNANSNASHFKAHAQYELGETQAGLDYLEDWMTGYDRRGIMQVHLAWHAALWALYLGDHSKMWSHVDASVAPGACPSALPINVLTDTAAIYWRAQLQGVEVPRERWVSLSAYAASCFPEAGQSFADIHAALAHAMAGDGDRLDKLAGAEKGFAADLVAPVSSSIQAILREDWAGALEALTPVMSDHARLGGSRAQRDILELTYANVLMRMGKGDEAGRLLRMRRPVLAKMLH